MKSKAALLLVVGSICACVRMTPVDEYVVLKHKLIEADVEEIRRISKQVEEQNDNNPGPDSRIRVALLLCSPQRSEEELIRARQILGDVLSFSSALSPSVEDFIEINRREIDQRLSAIKTIRENAELVESLEDERTRLRSEIESLQQSLAETNKKIKALKKIEESIDRPNKLEVP